MHATKILKSLAISKKLLRFLRQFTEDAYKRSQSDRWQIFVCKLGALDYQLSIKV